MTPPESRTKCEKNGGRMGGWPLVLQSDIRLETGGTDGKTTMSPVPLLKSLRRIPISWRCTNVGPLPCPLCCLPDAGSSQLAWGIQRTRKVAIASKSRLPDNCCGRRRTGPTVPNGKLQRLAAVGASLRGAWNMPNAKVQNVICRGDTQSLTWTAEASQLITIARADGKNHGVHL